MKKLAVLILFALFYGCYMVFTQILFAEEDLISIKGNVIRQYTFVKTEEWDKQQIKFTYLTFLLRGDERIYTLKVDAQNAVNGDRIFQGVYLALKESGEVKILVKKADLSKLGPKVYQIIADEQNIFDIKNKPSNQNQRLYGYLLFSFFLFCTTYYYFFLRQFAS
jgi:hypothetical protein